MEEIKTIKQIFRIHGLEQPTTVQRINTGFNRAVFDIDNKYVLKICLNPQKEDGVLREIDFYLNNNYPFTPRLIAFSTTKNILPYIYTIESKQHGQNLFDVWPKLTKEEKEQTLKELLSIIKTLHKRDNPNPEELTNLFNSYLNQAISSNVLKPDQIEQLRSLSERIIPYFKDTKFGFIHGDIHFNNIIYTEEGLKLIDFESSKIGPLDKEFDTLFRMARDPSSFSKDQNKDDYEGIIEFFIENYPEVCSEENFQNHLLIYDCINSLRWIKLYPDYPRYNDILFEQSKKLLK